MDLSTSEKSSEFSSLLQTLFLRRKELLTATVSVVAGIVILIVYFQSGPNPTSYASAESIFSQWMASPQDAELYEKMRKALKKVPGLEKKYEAAIAQKLLDGERMDEALDMAHRSLGRIKGDMPFHAAFATNSLLIEQKAYPDALIRAIELKEQMERNFDFNVPNPFAGGSLLYAYNLMRIACLQEKLKNASGEKVAWEEFEAFIHKKENISDLIVASFSEQKIDLNSYIAERKKSL